MSFTKKFEKKIQFPDSLESFQKKSAASVHSEKSGKILTSPGRREFLKTVGMGGAGIALVATFTHLLIAPCTSLAGAESWTVETSAAWKRERGASEGIAVKDDSLVLDGAEKGEWISKWRVWPQPVKTAEVVVEAEIDLFDNKTIEVVVDGSETPFTNAVGTPHDWYGRSMIAILDERRWVMALRSGVHHRAVDGPDAIHVVTSMDEGRTWSKLNRWFDGTPMAGVPDDDGGTVHVEPGLYRMPNGDLVLQFWRTLGGAPGSGTRQLRSTDDGKTWKPDIDRISVVGVPGADDDHVLGTQDWFIDPENPNDVYMAFQYLSYHKQAGTLLARTRDNGKTYDFLSWISRLASMSEDEPHSGAAFEPAIEYVGKRTIVAILRDSPGNHTYQSVSADMGRSFSDPVDVSDQVDGGVTDGAWKRARLYKDSNPTFQHGNRLDYAAGEGRLWGFGLHSIGKKRTRKPCVYWSDDNGRTWQGPQLLHGKMHPGTDAGYGDLKRRVDDTYVGAAYYATRDSTVSDIEQYTFGGGRARLMVEVDRDADGTADARSRWFEVYNGRSSFTPAELRATRWRLRLQLQSSRGAGSPRIRRVQLTPGTIWGHP